MALQECCQHGSKAPVFLVGIVRILSSYQGWGCLIEVWHWSVCFQATRKKSLKDCLAIGTYIACLPGDALHDDHFDVGLGAELEDMEDSTAVICTLVSVAVMEAIKPCANTCLPVCRRGHRAEILRVISMCLR